MAPCSRPGEAAPGLWGNWIVTDRPLSNGDYHLKYNFEAPYYSVSSANHPENSLPYFDALNRLVASDEANAARHGWKGIHFPASLGSWRMRPKGDESDYSQHSSAAYVTLNFLCYCQYTRGMAWNSGNTLSIQHIFPAGTIGLDSSSREL